MEPKEISPELAEKVLGADLQNLIRKVAAGKPMTAAERSRIEALAAGSTDSTTYAKTLVELADILGVTRRTLHNWQKLEGAPAALSNGYWPVADWREFIRLRGLKSGKPAFSNEDALKARKLLAEVEERELRLHVKKGQYVPIEEVREAWTINVGRARTVIESRLLNELPPVLSGMDAHGIRKELGLFLEEIYTLLHEGNHHR